MKDSFNDPTPIGSILNGKVIGSFFGGEGEDDLADQIRSNSIFSLFVARNFYSLLFPVETISVAWVQIAG